MAAQTYFPKVDVPRPEVLGGEQWHLDRLTPITVLFGKNGSGKSLMLRALRDANIAQSHYVVPERTGNLGFDAGLLQQQSDAQRRRDQSKGNFIPEYRQNVIARVQAYFVARGASREKELPGDPAVLERMLSRLLPDFAMQLVGLTPPYSLHRTNGEQKIENVEQLSSGEAQVLMLGLDALTIAAIWDIQKAPVRLLLLDEPDAHIHPDLQARFADFVVQLAIEFNLQVVIATHSTTLLAALGQFGDASCSVIYLDRTKNAFVAQGFSAALKELAACLGGHALMGPMFGVPLLLVEGDDDYRIWSQVPRHHVVNLAVIPSNGEEIYQYQTSLERVIGSIREASGRPAGYALLDSDKSLPDPKSKPQSQIQFIRLNCREAENLYLTDEVMRLLKTDWQNAVQAIVAAAPQHGQKGQKLANAAKWDRRTEDIKGVVQEVALAIDPKKVHWTQRVGVAIGSAKPQGQLEDFLGPELLSALWT